MKYIVAAAPMLIGNEILSLLCLGVMLALFLFDIFQSAEGHV